MNRFPKFYYLLLAVTLVFVGCSSDDDNPITPNVNESLELNKAIEGADGGYMNVAAPAIKSADEVNEALASNKNWYIVDVRSATDYAAGHIQSAVNVPVAEIVDHVLALNHASYETIAVVCYTGQSAGWGTALLRMSGVTNAFSMKYGMSSWNPATDRITSKCSDNYVSHFVNTASPPKNTMGELPAISTGKSTGADILAARVKSVLAEGYGPAAITPEVLLSDPSQYYIVNYWPMADYTTIGHINGSIQYTPKADLKFATFLKTLPTDKTIVVYCYTGQTSANVAAVLRVMGYNAKSLAYGTNGMIWTKMSTSGKTFFKAENDTRNYPMVQ
jgi:rhodanese-related sulfurtransferase